MAALAKETPEFQEFVETVEAIKKRELNRSWLLHMWTGAGCDMQIAVTHVFDTPEDKLVPRGANEIGDQLPASPSPRNTSSEDKKHKSDTKMKTSSAAGGSKQQSYAAGPIGDGLAGLAAPKSSRKRHSQKKSSKVEEASGADTPGFGCGSGGEPANAFGMGGADAFGSTSSNNVASGFAAFRGFPGDNGVGGHNEITSSSIAQGHFGNDVNPIPFGGSFADDFGTVGTNSTPVDASANATRRGTSLNDSSCGVVGPNGLGSKVAFADGAWHGTGTSCGTSGSCAIGTAGAVGCGGAGIAETFAATDACGSWAGFPAGQNGCGKACRSCDRGVGGASRGCGQAFQLPTATQVPPSGSSWAAQGEWAESDSDSEEDWWGGSGAFASTTSWGQAGGVFAAAGIARSSSALQPSGNISFSRPGALPFSTSDGGCGGTSAWGGAGGNHSGEGWNGGTFSGDAGFGGGSGGGYGGFGCGGSNGCSIAGGNRSHGYSKGNVGVPSSGGFGFVTDEAQKLKILLSHGGRQLDGMVIELHNQLSGNSQVSIAEVDQIVRGFLDNTAISSQAFRNLHMMYERFDFDGDGRLDLQEMKQLFRSCVRSYQQEVDPKVLKSKDMKLAHKNVEDDFTVLKKLGEGGQGAMYLVGLIDEPTELRCVKFYSKSNTNAPLDDIKEEFALMRKLDSPFVARTYDIFEDFHHVYLVNEPYFGGNLTKAVSKASEAKVAITEDWFRGVFLQPAQGILYLNQQYIMHCDLKEENIMVATGTDWHNPQVVLIDFGLASKFTTDSVGVYGTPGYIPPETYEKHYWVPKGDVFSLGVVFFQMLGGVDGLFTESVSASTTEGIMRSTIQSQPPFNIFNDKPHFQDLVRRMLEKTPYQRSCIGDVTRSPWFSEHTGALIDSHIVEQIRKFSQKNENQLKIGEMMLDRVNLGGLKQLNNAFLAIDRDMSGTLTVEEARQGASRVAPELGLSPEELEKFLRGLADRTGHVSYKRFMGAMIHHQYSFNTADLWSRFCKIDSNRDGVLDSQEIMQVILSMNYPEHEAMQLFSHLDKDRDGRVTFDEFKRAVLGDPA